MIRYITKDIQQPPEYNREWIGKNCYNCLYVTTHQEKPACRFFLDSSLIKANLLFEVDEDGNCQNWVKK